MIKDCHILKISNFDIANGPGVRVSVWVAGCCHACKGCHNRNTWKWKQGTELTNGIIEDILDLCDNDLISGLSLSGGDPLFPKNRDGIAALCKAFKQRFKNKDIWLWTGYLLEEVKDLEAIKYIDVIIDGKFVEELKDLSLPYCGSSNQRVIKLKNISLKGN